MKEKIKNKLFDKTWKKSVILFLIVFFMIFIGGIMSINYLNDIVSNNYIHSEVITVTDKIYGDNHFSDYFLIVADNNKTYSIIDHKDGYGEKMFNSMEVNGTYKVTIKDPEPMDLKQFSHILQVRNVTN